LIERLSYNKYLAGSQMYTIMPGVFLLSGHTTGGNIAILKSLIGTGAGLIRRQWLLIIYLWSYNGRGGRYGRRLV
jgi:muramoyltetrapeptide carboxypeptidase LdcA involved in peptidoglycan recycling